MRSVVVVGAGQAAARAVATLRQKGFDGAITLVGDEPDLPYERPPLSKSVLEGKAEPQVGRLYDPKFYADNRIDVALGETAIAVDLFDCCVTLASGSRISYDRLLLATGARARRLQLPGLAPERVMTLRNAADAIRLHAELGNGRRVVIVGGGFVGLEVAASAIQRGCQVTVLEMQPHLLSRCVSAESAKLIENLHLSRGVDIRTNCNVLGAEEGRGGGIRVQLGDHSWLEAEVVVAGIGAVPNSELAAAAGIACDGGVLVDEFCRTSVPGVFAAGDVTHHVNARYGRRMRVESWENAELQGVLAGSAMMDQGLAHSAIPWFWTEQFDVNLQIIGLPSDGERTVKRAAATGTGSYLCFHLRANHVVAAELVNAGRERRLIKQLIESGCDVVDAVLADSAVSLRQLL